MLGFAAAERERSLLAVLLRVRTPLLTVPLYQEPAAVSLNSMEVTRQPR